MYLKLILPITIHNLISIWVTFDGIANLLAEITCFSDRQFYLVNTILSFIYKDFWNSKSTDEFWKKCNVIVPKFIKYHVYCPLLRYNCNRTLALVFTQILSFLFVEMVMVTLGFAFFKRVFSGLLLGFPEFTLFYHQFFGIRYPKYWHFST